MRKIWLSNGAEHLYQGLLSLRMMAIVCGCGTRHHICHAWPESWTVWQHLVQLRRTILDASLLTTLTPGKPDMQLKKKACA